MQEVGLHTDFEPRGSDAAQPCETAEEQSESGEDEAMSEVEEVHSGEEEAELSEDEFDISENESESDSESESALGGYELSGPDREIFHDQLADYMAALPPQVAEVAQSDEFRSTMEQFFFVTVSGPMR